MKLKNLNFLKTVVLLGMFVFFGFVSVISAEDISFENSNDGIQLNQDGNTVPFMPSASVSIKKINFDEATRRLNVQVDLKNNTTNFLDDLEYTIEIMKGDTLVENGYLFGNTEHTYRETKSFGKLAPNEESNKIFFITIPKNIETANYFVQIFINDKNLKFQNVDYIEEPMLLKGVGGRLSGLKVYFFSDNTGKSFPSAGLSTRLEESPKLMVPLDENKSVDEYLKSGRKLDYRLVITDTMSDKKVVFTGEGSFQRGILADQDSIFAQLSPSNDDLKRGGSFDVALSFVDDKGEEIFKKNVRWLIEYGQLMTRILSVDSGKNLYKKGEGLDVTVETASFNGKGKTIVAELSLVGGWWFEETFVKEVVMDEYETKIIFDNPVSKRVKLKEMNLVVKDKETGKILDTYNMDVNYFGIYGSGNYYFAYAFFGILFLLVGIFFYLEKTKKLGFLVILVLFGITGTFLTNYQKTEAVDVCACAAGMPTSQFWVSKEPVVPTCGGTAYMDVSLRVYCSTCINGLESTVTNNAGGSLVTEYGHITDQTIVHRVTKTISTSPTTISATAKLTRNGCHCCSSTVTTNLCAPGSVNGAYCPINVAIGTLSRSVSCNLPGDCSTKPLYRDGSYLSTETAWPAGSTWCRLGTSSGTPAAFPTPGQTVWWSCLPIPQGTGLGDTCSATRAAINGACGNRANSYSPTVAPPYPVTTTAWPAGSAYCASGNNTTSPAFPATGSSVSWICQGTGGTNASCSASRDAIPYGSAVCGDKDGTYSYSTTAYPVGSAWCDGGTETTFSPSAKFPDQGEMVTWKCDYYGAIANCSAYRELPPAVGCGTRNSYRSGTYLSTETTWPVSSTWCQFGELSGATPSFPSWNDAVSWNCYDSGTGQTAVCQAMRNGPGECSAGTCDVNCGTLARAFSYETTAWPAGNWCLIETTAFNPDPNPVTFPTRGGISAWLCEMGLGSASCSASRSAIPTGIGNCGANERDYELEETAWENPTSGWCTSGLADSNPSFPAIGNTATWICQGTISNDTCNATHTTAGCGDGVCALDERDSCFADCCGNLSCGLNENFLNCPVDCLLNVIEF
ncbi:hypothetical protein A3E89_02020 [Candidatus Campbellbacteria bacterium RIFCSPHIGHO2_12_FULL_35_10]|uniref:Uncharacterized protein n=1 Tax=Candidatus Campbellbacteria bacterium RIFCSPHIGHO2_12_FULL_35_10 TaxID=1797578 RepID=A0A1F5EQL5_9BACT|nr:MAG: hypothetical protein A3E89_02020 [Candidatus Campbellbacteria bacterium RIFCSPHIGHO2_12_FULL_35_10]